MTADGTDPDDLSPASPQTGLTRRQLLATVGLVVAAGVTGCTTVDAPTASTAPTSAPPGGSIAVPSLQIVTASPDSAGAASAPSSSTALPMSPAPTAVPAIAGEVSRGSGARPQVALTFHGAGDPATARDLLEAVDSRGALITVMVVGSWLHANPELASRILSAGHELGNHTWSHPVLAELPEDQIRQEVTRCRDLLVALTGSPGAYFRPSSAQYATDAIRLIAGESGYPTCLSYDIDSTDWTDPGPQAVRRVVATATAGSIVSLHLGHPGTVQALPGVLDDLAARGLTPVTASTLLGA